MYKLCFYVPQANLEAVKQAVFQAGAGKIGHYDHCCWQTLGQGQFRPLAGSQPAIGEPPSGAQGIEAEGTVEVVEEYKVELVCADDLVAGVIQALKAAHPYEEPAYDVWKLEAL